MAFDNMLLGTFLVFGICLVFGTCSVACEGRYPPEKELFGSLINGSPNHWSRLFFRSDETSFDHPAPYTPPKVFGTWQLRCGALWSPNFLGTTHQHFDWCLKLCRCEDKCLEPPVKELFPTMLSSPPNHVKIINGSRAGVLSNVKRVETSRVNLSMVQGTTVSSRLCSTL